MSSIHELATQKREAADSLAEHQQDVDRLLAHIYEISNDPRGSDPAQYVGEEGAETVREFLRMAESLGWPDAQPISMRRGRMGLKAWRKNTPLGMTKDGLTKALFFPRATYNDEGNTTQLGYIFTELDLHNIRKFPPVAICQDGEFRSWRYDELGRSKAFGWGRLPDLDYLPSTRTGIKLPFVYQRRGKSLEEALISTIKPEHLPRTYTVPLPERQQLTPPPQTSAHVLTRGDEPKLLGPGT